MQNAKYRDIINKDGFLYAKGTDPYLFVAHMDRFPTLKERVININEEKDDGIASFNISYSYFDEHSKKEYIVLEEMIDCYNAVDNVINNLNKKYEAFV